MARKASATSAARPTGVNRKSVQKAGRKKKQRKSTQSSSRRSTTSTRLSSQHSLHIDETNAGDDSIQDIEDTQNDVSVVESRRKPFVYLKAKTRQIPQEKITTEWRNPTTASQEKIREILTIAKRSIVHVTKNKKRVQQAEEAVETVMQKMMKKVPLMPFPPRTKEINFDLEKLLEQSVSVGMAIFNVKIG
jgi:hypothetical protein